MRRPLREILGFIGFNPTGDLGPYTLYTRPGERTVVFLRAPPRRPATWFQHQQRNAFRAVAYAWATLTPANRTHWNTLARRANLRITAYNLFVHVATRGQDDTLATLLHQTGVTDAQLWDPDTP